MTLTATDLFCGAGGSSLGAETAGVRLAMGANHWPKAIEVHQENFPDAGHDCADISQVDPRRYPRTDILLASPECTNHSSAKGVSRKAQNPSLFDSPDLGAERSRATMWDVHRFVEHHRYDAVVVENVVDAARWLYWPSWWQAWDDAGYDARVLSINSAHTGAVHQWRDRIYVVAVRRGLTAPDLDFRPPSWCSKCETVVAGVQSFKRPEARVGKWRQQYEYRCPACAEIVAPPAPPAAGIIDWDLPAGRIGDRKRPLADATLRRIRVGIERYGAALVAGAGNTWERQHAVTHPPMVVPLKTNGRARPAEAEPLNTVCSSANPAGLLMAPQSDGRAMPTDQPAPSLTATVPPMLVPYNRTGAAHPVSEPAGTLTTKDRMALYEHDVDLSDCLFRMLEPHEVKAAMAFPASYEARGTKTELVKLWGNAVTPPVMSLIVRRLAAALEAA